MDTDLPSTWGEDASASFLDYGRYFVPDRDTQIQIICDLLPAGPDPLLVMELAHGEGLLAEAILERRETAVVHGYDLSQTMRRHAAGRLARFGPRFQTHPFDLRRTDWRTPPFTPQAVVTSLTVHHLDGPGKLRLFQDMHAILAPGGAFIIADLIAPAGPLANHVAAAAWDTAVQESAQALDGHLEAFAAFRQLEWNLFRHPDPEIDQPSRLFDQLIWLAQAGFTAIDVYWLRAGHAIFGGTRP